MRAPTKRQLAIVAFIRGYCESHGFSPRAEDVRREFGMKSIGSVYRVLDVLTLKGLVTREPNQARTIRIVERVVEPATTT